MIYLPRDHVIKVSCDFVGGAPSSLVTSLLGLESIGLMELMAFVVSMHCTFHYVLSLCNLHVSFYQSHSKSNDYYLFRKRLTNHQFNVQTATAENIEQDTLSNTILIQFLIMIFCFEVYFEAGSP